MYLQQTNTIWKLSEIGKYLSKALTQDWRCIWSITWSVFTEASSWVQWKPELQWKAAATGLMEWRFQIWHFWFKLSITCTRGSAERCNSEHLHFNQWRSSCQNGWNWMNAGRSLKYHLESFWLTLRCNIQSIFFLPCLDDNLLKSFIVLLKKVRLCDWDSIVSKKKKKVVAQFRLWLQQTIHPCVSVITA